MTLIEEFIFEERNIKFYRNIDFDILINHPKDGSGGFIFCFIENWVKEIQSYNRNNKLKSIINNTQYSDFDWDNIDNDYICIYQADGISVEKLYESIKDKVISRNYLPKSSYLHIKDSNNKGISNSGGAWKIKSEKK